MTLTYTQERKCNTPPDYKKMPKLAKSKLVGVTKQKESPEEIESCISILLVAAVSSKMKPNVMLAPDLDHTVFTHTAVHNCNYFNSCTHLRQTAHIDVFLSIFNLQF